MLPEFEEKMGKGSVLMGTECLSSTFPDSLCLLSCAPIQRELKIGKKKQSNCQCEGSESFHHLMDYFHLKALTRNPAALSSATQFVYLEFKREKGRGRKEGKMKKRDCRVF